MSINLPVFGDDIFDGWVVSLFPSVVVVVLTTGAVSEKNRTIKSNTNHTTPSEKFKYLIENRRNRGTIDTQSFMFMACYIDTPNRHTQPFIFMACYMYFN